MKAFFLSVAFLAVIAFAAFGGTVTKIQHSEVGGLTLYEGRTTTLVTDAIDSTEALAFINADWIDATDTMTGNGEFRVLPMSIMVQNTTATMDSTQLALDYSIDGLIWTEAQALTNAFPAAPLVTTYIPSWSLFYRIRIKSLDQVSGDVTVKALY